jgi:anti-sigma B factor antagonist
MTAPLVGFDPDGLAIQSTWSADACAITVTGDVDATTAPALEEALLGWLDHPDVAEVQLDLRGVTFLDSAGLTTLVVADRAAQNAGRGLSLRCGSSRAVLRPLEITGLLTVLTVTDRPTT